MKEVKNRKKQGFFRNGYLGIVVCVAVSVASHILYYPKFSKH